MSDCASRLRRESSIFLLWMADVCHDVSFIGRLATYKYYHMDQVVGMALAEVDSILRKSKESKQ
jgi:UDP-galactopyranose mutase